MVQVAFGPRTASFAKWLVGISRGDVIKDVVLVRDYAVQPETLNARTFIYSYKLPSALLRMAGSESLTRQPMIVYQPWASIRRELQRRQLKWKATDFCGWVRWASKVLEPAENIDCVVDVLTPSDCHDMMTLFPQKSCRKTVLYWVAKLGMCDNPTALQIHKRWRPWQVVLLPC